jgi:hypothetical protein
MANKDATKIISNKDTPGPGQYEVKSFFDNNKTNMVFGSAPRFPKPPEATFTGPTINTDGFVQAEDKLKLDRYFDIIGKNGPFVTIKGRYASKSTNSLPGPGNYDVKYLKNSPSFSMGRDQKIIFKIK